VFKILEGVFLWGVGGKGGRERGRKGRRGGMRRGW
jgi:hypothetical protein